jgi:hypothetical protein
MRPHDFKVGDKVVCVKRRNNDFFREPRVGDLCRVTGLNGERDIWVEGYSGSYAAERFRALTNAEKELLYLTE